MDLSDWANVFAIITGIVAVGGYAKFLSVVVIPDLLGYPEMFNKRPDPRTEAGMTVY